jgi:hypothetical protein
MKKAKKNMPGCSVSQLRSRPSKKEVTSATALAKLA